MQGTPDPIGKSRLCAMHVCVLGGAMCRCLCVLPCQAHRLDKGTTQSEAHGGGRRKQDEGDMLGVGGMGLGICGFGIGDLGLWVWNLSLWELGIVGLWVWILRLGIVGFGFGGLGFWDWGQLGYSHWESTSFSF